MLAIVREDPRVRLFANTKELTSPLQAAEVRPCQDFSQLDDSQAVVLGDVPEKGFDGLAHSLSLN